MARASAIVLFVIAPLIATVLSTGTSRPLVARPVFADAFVIGQLTVQFIRDARGVHGFEISHPRARRLAFTRSTRKRTRIRRS